MLKSMTRKTRLYTLHIVLGGNLQTGVKCAYPKRSRNIFRIIYPRKTNAQKAKLFLKHPLRLLLTHKKVYVITWETSLNVYTFSDRK